MSEVNTQPLTLLVVIINYFSAHLVKSIVRQLCDQQLPEQIKLSIICADNSVTQEQREALTEIEDSFTSQFTLKLNSKNLGFGNAINDCVEGQNFDFLCCINPDVALFKDTIPKLMTHAFAHPEQGIWGGITISDNNQPDFRHAWQEPSLKNTFAWATGLSRVLKGPSWQGNYQHIDTNTQQPYPVDSISGCCFMMSFSAWQTVKGFDGNFFLYSEEIDLCRRARQAGFQPTIVSNVKLRHSHHSKAEALRRVISIYSAKCLYINKHHGILFSACYNALLSLGASLRAIKHLLTGNLLAANIWATLIVKPFIWTHTSHRKNQ